jgi:hypothetical protein
MEILQKLLSSLREKVQGVFGSQAWGETRVDSDIDLQDRSNITRPPSHLDGAKVLYWAWSDDQPFDYDLTLACGDDVEIYGFAICTYEDGDYYLFSCNRQWEVVNDTVWGTPQEYLEIMYPSYFDQTLHRIKYDDTDINVLLEECQRINFYREIGGRRIIQRIVTHLQQHNCRGMGVHSEAKDIWLLSIRKKDIPLASEIAEQNVNR